MPVQGTLSSMSLYDLLQWASANQKTGVLEIERNKVVRRIEFRKGWISACSSDDPPTRLGQFLLSRGKITKQALEEALQRQQTCKKNLGLILVEMGSMPQTELNRQVALKAEETVHGLFDWDEAYFRFDEGATLSPDLIMVNLSARQIFLRGIQRADELKRIREAFGSSGVVLQLNVEPDGAGLAERPMARRILASIDGKRTIAEILLHAHASEYPVLKFLFKLLEKGLVEIIDTRPIDEATASLLDVHTLNKASRPLQWRLFDEHRGESDTTAPEASATVAEAPDARPAPDFEVEVEVARQLIDRGELAAALELLNASYRAHPGERTIRALIDRAEAAFIHEVSKDDLAYDNVPRRVPDVRREQLQKLDPVASYLLSQVDGNTDVQALLWLSPLREADALKGLRRLLDDEIIELAEATSQTDMVYRG